MWNRLSDEEMAKAEAKMKEDNDRDLAAYAKMHYQLGYEIGVKIVDIETAKNLKELGVEINTIIEITGLSKEEIENL